MAATGLADVVLYGKDIGRLAQFYTQVLGLREQHREWGWVVLASAAWQLELHAIPAKIAKGISTPPHRRENVALKFFAAVPSLADAGAVAESLDGALLPSNGSPCPRGLLSRSFRSGRLLLRGAVDAAAARRDGIDIELHNLAPRELLAQEGAAVAVSAGIAKLRADHRAVADVEVDIACRKILALILRPDFVRPRHAQHLQGAATRVRRLAQDGQVALGDRIFWRGPVVVNTGNHDPGRAEAGIKVGVAIGDVVAGNAGQPDHLVYPQHPV